MVQGQFRLVHLQRLVYVSFGSTISEGDAPEERRLGNMHDDVADFKFRQYFCPTIFGVTSRKLSDNRAKKFLNDLINQYNMHA